MKYENPTINVEMIGVDIITTSGESSTGLVGGEIGRGEGENW